MNKKIAILHREKAKRPGTTVWGVDTADWVPWETCLRQVYFGSADHVPQNLPDDVEVYRGKEAYDFCLKIVCGLRSPMVGETEVWGQFKALFRNFDYASYRHAQVLRKFIDHIFSDAKAVRHQHLTGLGSQSYGSLARRILKDTEEVNIIGSGLLVKDMLPWLVKSSAKVRIICRSVEKGLERLDELKNRPSSIEVVNINEVKSLTFQGGVIIAAPVEARWVQESFSQVGNEIQKVVDLRDNSTKDRVHMNCDVISLVDFFQEIKATREQVAQRVIDAEKEINSLIQKRFSQIQIRPRGWDDLWL